MNSPKIPYIKLKNRPFGTGHKQNAAALRQFQAKRAVKTMEADPLRKFLFRLLALVILLALIGLVGFAYLGDLSPARQDQRLPVTLEVE